MPRVCFFLSFFFLIAHRPTSLLSVLGQVWSLDNFSLLQTLLRHEHSVDCIVARGGRIYSGAADSTIKVRAAKEREKVRS